MLADVSDQMFRNWQFECTFQEY